MSTDYVRTHPNDTVAALHELAVALEKNAEAPRTTAQRVADVLARTDLAPLDLVAYLVSKGFEGVRCAQAIGTFAPAVRDAYQARYGHLPLKVLRRDRLVNSYLEVDRPLVDEVFASWSK